MSINITKLRQQAYKDWGLNTKRVIFDFPNARSNEEFIFKLDYHQKHASWPRAYSLLPHKDHEPLLRVIVPVRVIKNREGVDIERTAFYDIPLELHEQILAHIERNTLTRPLSFWKKIANKILPKQLRYNELVETKDYMFAVTLDNKEMYLRAI